MFDELHIIGIGIVGSNLAITLPDYFSIGVLHLYDSDIVTSDDPLFPFNSDSFGLYKVDVIKSYLDIKYNDEIEVISNKYNIYSSINSGFVIDCRDNKSHGLYSDLRISLDAHSLILDSLKDQSKEKEYSNYYNVKKLEYTPLAISVIITYLKRKMYKNNNKILYDLNDFIKSYITISK